jgi:hypothetical protein
MSSTATTTGEVKATDRRQPRTARETARWSARRPILGSAGGPPRGPGAVAPGTVGSASSRNGLEEVTEGSVGQPCLGLDRTA